MYRIIYYKLLFLIIIILCISSCKGSKGDLSGGGTTPVAGSVDCINGVDASVYSIYKFGNGYVALAGNFTDFDGTTVNRFVVLNSDCRINSTFTTNFGTGITGGSVNSIAYDGTEYFYVVGDFTTCNGNACGRIAKIKTDGTFDTSFNSGNAGFAGGAAHSIVFSGSNLYVGGAFTTYNAADPIGIAKLSTSGVPDATFVTNAGTGFNSTVRSVFIHGSSSDIYAGGDFTSFNSQTFTRLAKIANNGTYDSTFSTSMATGFDLEVHSIFVYGSDVSYEIYAGGDFTAFKGSAIKRVAKLSSTATLDSAFQTAVGTGFDSTVRSIYVDGVHIYAGGDFSSFNSQDFNYVAKLTVGGVYSSTFLTNMGTSGFNNSFRTIFVESGYIYAGGDFTTFEGSNISPRYTKMDTNGVIATYYK
jgi:hypothetical protein